jgi:hypothetical protein
VSFRKFEAIHEFKEGPQNMRYLLLHVGTKFFHLGVHVYFFNGINFNLQLQYFLGKFHIQLAEAKTFDNSQYPHHLLTTNVVTIGENASQIASTIAQVCAEGIMFTKAFV